MYHPVCQSVCTFISILRSVCPSIELVKLTYSATISATQTRNFAHTTPYCLVKQNELPMRNLSSANNVVSSAHFSARAPSVFVSLSKKRVSLYNKLFVAITV
jgi:hypothetical protein